MEKNATEKGLQLTPLSPKDPNANDFAENFVKQQCKLVHTVTDEDKSPKTELYNFLLHYRATPHSTTNVYPAEMLFHRKLSTKLPHVFVKKDIKEIAQIRQDHDKKKMVQKNTMTEEQKRNQNKLQQVVLF